MTNDVCRSKTAKAITCGRIILPGSCQNCGSTKNLECHHLDYSDPYNVIQLCRVCHVAAHRIIRNNIPKRVILDPSSRCNLWIPKEMSAKLKEAKKATGLPVVVIMRQAVEKWLKELGL